MKQLKLTRITNLWNKTFQDNNQLFSRIVIESTYPLNYQLKKLSQKNVILTVHEAIANMYCETLEIYDGLINEITVRQKDNNCVDIDIALNHSAPCKITSTEGIPVRTQLIFERTHLNEIFSHLKIVLDPGHGGNDTGGTGPVDLLEKDVVMIMAGQLKKQLEQVGAQIFLTRKDDRTVSAEQRIKLARSEEPDAFISFHTHYSKNPKINGMAVKYNQACAGSIRLAQIVCEETVRKIKRQIRELRPDTQLYGLGNIPGITVEPLTISNWVEEGLLRNPYLYEKIAMGILNGLYKFFSDNI